MVFANPEDVEPHRIGVCNPFEQLLHRSGRTDGHAGAGVQRHRREAVDSDFHEGCSKVSARIAHTLAHAERTL
jgi:hypothetical protein